jgi:N-acetylmuramoyl-L-alanine amidase
MKIQNHLLVEDDGTPVPFVRTPNVGGALKPTWLVMHYTAGSSAKESINWMANPQAKASAHIVIARDGRLTQMVPFNRVAWHAGKSGWQGVNGLNRHSIGIELDNAGRLTRKGSAWTAAFGGRFPESQVLEATHKNETQPSGWQTYTKAQLDAAREVATLIVQAYGLKDVIGHDDISPGRKADPGPAFPMAEFRARVLAGVDPQQPARPEEKPATVEAPAATAISLAFFAVTASRLNIRGGPGTSHPKVDGSPVPRGTIVQELADEGAWKKVLVHGTVRGETGITGWVSARYLKPAVPILKVVGTPEPAPAG